MAAFFCQFYFIFQKYNASGCTSESVLKIGRAAVFSKTTFITYAELTFISIVPGLDKSVFTCYLLNVTGYIKEGI